MDLDAVQLKKCLRNISKNTFGNHKKKWFAEFCCKLYRRYFNIFWRTFVEHLIHIEKLMQAIQQEGFRLKFIKWELAMNTVKYLGHVIEENLVRPLDDNLVSITEFPTSKTHKNICQFSGKVNFYRKYIPNSAATLEPFCNLLRKDVDFLWSDECQLAFEQVKKYLTTAPALAIFNRNKPINIYTDASGEGIGAIPKQPQESGEEKPVAYFSKKLDDAQKRKKVIYVES